MELETQAKPKYLETLKLLNFTCFKEAEFRFSPGINAFIGKNGTGKTHLMKAMYAALRPPTREIPNVPVCLQMLFLIDSPYELFRSGTLIDELSEVSGKHGEKPWEYSFAGLTQSEMQGTVKPIGSQEGSANPNGSQPIFIPALEMMGHTKNFQSAYNYVYLDFDLTCYDIVTLFNLKSKQGETSLRSGTLTKLLGGEVVSDESAGRFFLQSPAGKLPMPMVAEGLRKVASLVRILENNWLQPGSVLFWDEPEVNLNPALMTDVVKALLELSRQGVQIFLATHSYVILKELDLQASLEDAVAYFSLESCKEGTQVASSDSFASLKPNAILEHFGSLYDRDISRATRRSKPLAKMP